MYIRTSILSLAIMGFVGISFLVSAQTLLVDPTRPANKVVVVEETDEQGNPLVPLEPGQLPGQQAAFPNPKISAIIVTEEVKYAIIDNEVVYEGQQWRNVLLASIKPYSITLSLNDQKKEITINNNDFITESNENF